MIEPIIIDLEEGIAAVKHEGNWRFFHDNDWMFLLDYRAYAYAPDETPRPTDPRRNTLVVNENNAEEWMNLLAGELTFEQIPYAVYDDGAQAPLMFVIDFDEKLWIGHRWHMDQSALDDYQPADWLADEDDVFKYVPEEIAHLWDGQLVAEAVEVRLNTVLYPLIPAGLRPYWWDKLCIPFAVGEHGAQQVEIRQGNDRLAKLTLDQLPTDQPFNLCFDYTLDRSKRLRVDIVRRKLNSSIVADEAYADIGPFALR